MIKTYKVEVSRSTVINSTRVSTKVQAESGEEARKKAIEFLEEGGYVLPPRKEMAVAVTIMDTWISGGAGPQMWYVIHNNEDAGEWGSHPSATHDEVLEEVRKAWLEKYPNSDPSELSLFKADNYLPFA